MNRRIAARGLAAASLFLGTTLACAAAIDDTKAKSLMTAGGCTTCHAVDHKVVGPAFKDIAAKRKAESGAVATLEKKVRAGGKGDYGAIPMPPNAEAKINDSDLHELVEWILTK